MINISSEVYLFLHALIYGLLTGTIYDLFKIKRMVFKSNKMIVLIDDVLFWTIMGIIFIFATHSVYNGELRFYLLVGLVLGIVLYTFILSETIVKFGIHLAKIIIIPFRFIFKNFSKLKRKCDIVYRRNLKQLFHASKENSK